MFPLRIKLEVMTIFGACSLRSPQDIHLVLLFFVYLLEKFFIPANQKKIFYWIAEKNCFWIAEKKFCSRIAEKNCIIEVVPLLLLSNSMKSMILHIQNVESTRFFVYKVTKQTR